jgi:excisionase family DNA binding protein
MHDDSAPKAALLSHRPCAAFFTPRDVADQLGLTKTDTVLTWIHTGELPAVNVSAGAGRPTWRIDPADLERFLAGRRAAPAKKTRRHRPRKTPPTDVISFF